MSSDAGLAAVVFDLDGVLIDSEPVWDAARREVAAAAGGHWREEATRAMMGMSSREWSAYMHNELGVELTPEEINDRVVARLLAHYQTEGPPLLPGAGESVRRLAAHWPLGLASSANREVIDAVLDAARLTSFFAATVSAEEVAHGKPAGDVYLAAASALGVAPDRAVAVEDSTNGLRAAAAAGLAVIAVPNARFPPDQDALELASVVVDSLTELTPDAVGDAAGDVAARARSSAGRPAGQS
jgi:HAD superfamily hydrolase (TIGR01509 family)